MGAERGMGPRIREDTGRVGMTCGCRKRDGSPHPRGHGEGGEFFGNEILRLRYASLRMTYGGKGEGNFRRETVYVYRNYWPVPSKKRRGLSIISLSTALSETPNSRI